MTTKEKKAFLHHLEMLANGINPINRKTLHDSSLMHNAYNIRFINLLCGELKQASKDPELTPAQKEQDNLRKGKPRRDNFQWLEEEMSLLESAWRDNYAQKDIVKYMHRTTEDVIQKLIELGLLPAHEAEDFRQRSA